MAAIFMMGKRARLSDAASSKLARVVREKPADRLARELGTTVTTILGALDGGTLRAETCARLEASLRTYSV